MKYCKQTHLISLGPNLVPGLLEVAVSTGTPTMHASSWAVSCTRHVAVWRLGRARVLTDRADTGSRMKEAMPAGRGSSFWCVGWLYWLGRAR